jgi:hypothetical protein
VLGGDKAALGHVMDDSRLQSLARLAVEPRLAVPDPKFAVLKDSPQQFRAIRIHLTEPE